MIKVLIVATSHKTRGGITAVIKANKQGEQWTQFHCRWIETHIDKGVIWKLAYLLQGCAQYLLLLPLYDIVHIHTSEPPSAIRKCLFVFLAKLFRKKIIIHFHAFSPKTTIQSKYKRIYRYLFCKADYVIVLSEYWKKIVENEFHLNGKIQIVYNPCTTEISNKIYIKKKQILYAGIINSRKGYKDMIRAFSYIANKFPQWQIVFAGNGEIEQGIALSKELGIDHQVFFLGWVNGDDKDKAFKEATIFCLPSYAEGFPMSVLDAWAYGLPVITTPVGGIPDIVVDGCNALLFNSGDVQTLSRKMELLITNDQLRDKISEESLLLANTKFNINTINYELEEIYKKLSF